MIIGRIQNIIQIQMIHILIQMCTWRKLNQRSESWCETLDHSNLDKEKCQIYEIVQLVAPLVLNLRTSIRKQINL